MSMISFEQAYQLTLSYIRPLPLETVDLLAAVGRIAGKDLPAIVDSPSTDVSLKDGYAVRSADICDARPEHPVCLSISGSAAAGGSWQGTLQSGQAVRILSGAPVPGGADAVISEEFTRVRTDQPGLEKLVEVVNYAESGRNILPCGADVQEGKLMVSAGQRLHPAVIGLLAAAGYQEVPVIRLPRVAVLATGDEVLAPGQPFEKGKLYASNLYTLAAWCRRLGFEVETFILPDEAGSIRQTLTTCLEQFNAILTSGGAWKGEHDLVVQMLDALGWRKIYHRVRMGPGKAVGFGIFQNKPVVCLPGGPPSNNMAFLQLALPGLQKLSGDPHPGLPQRSAIMGETVSGPLGWTQFVHGRFLRLDHHLLFQPAKQKSRLQEVAETQAIVKIPEELEELKINSSVIVQMTRNPGDD